VKLIWGKLFALIGVLMALVINPQSVSGRELIKIPPGSYQSAYRNEGDPVQVQVDGFLMDALPVTNDQFFNFVKDDQRWRRSARNDLLADSHYLSHWKGDLDPAGPNHYLDSPVTNVSWFAGLTMREGSGELGFNQYVLEWYSRPAPPVLPAVGNSARNFFGIGDMHGLIWEWVLDFNSILVSGESRGDGGLERELFCGVGAIRSANVNDYPAFMRFGLRSSLQARYTVNNLGFRCAADLLGSGINEND
jgi:formylglycine-generating enzyme required for sulfatase activity